MDGGNSIGDGLSMLVGILKRERDRGADTVAISSGAETTLRMLPASFMNQFVKRPAAAQSAGKKADVGERLSPRELRTDVTDQSRPSHGRRFPIHEVVEDQRTESWAREQLNAIFKAVKNCPECRSLGTLYETVVFASGNPGAEIMFVGEAPGDEEEKLKKPLVGPAGQKLEQILKAMGLKREDVYLSNIVKFRPKKGDGRFQGSSDRSPQPDEMAASLKYIRAEIAVVSPKVLVVLGRTAAEGLLEKGGTLAGFRNSDHEFEGIPVVVTHDPGYLIRQESETSPEQAMQAKRMVWEDMMKAMQFAGMAISDKQRSYFS